LPTSTFLARRSATKTASETRSRVSPALLQNGAIRMPARRRYGSRKDLASACFPCLADRIRRTVRDALIPTRHHGTLFLWSPASLVGERSLAEGHTRILRGWSFDFSALARAEWARVGSTQAHEDANRSETLAGLSLLDVAALNHYRVIFTNYETVTNYQFSFARRDLNWSVLVTDEGAAVQDLKHQNLACT
jgi:hypothetical protein